jgi:hypothetical protein
MFVDFIIAEFFIWGTVVLARFHDEGNPVKGFHCGEY